MNNSTSIVGKWQHYGNGFEAVFNFGPNAAVSWNGQANGKSFRCKGIYDLDETLTPSILRITNVAIVEIDAADDGKKPFVEEGLVLKFYQEFDGGAVMRLEGMAAKPENEPAYPKIRNGPATMLLNRL